MYNTSLEPKLLMEHLSVAVPPAYAVTLTGVGLKTGGSVVIPTAWNTTKETNNLKIYSSFLKQIMLYLLSFFLFIFNCFITLEFGVSVFKSEYINFNVKKNRTNKFIIFHIHYL